MLFLLLVCASGCALIRPQTTDSVCPIHQTQLKDHVVPVSYGLIRLPRYYTVARETIFPHATRVVFGGDVLSTNAPREQAVSYCAQCRNAKEVFDNSLMWQEADLKENAEKDSNKAIEGTSQ